MDHKGFLHWLGEVEDLSETQKAELRAVLAGQPSGAAANAAIEMAVGEERPCPHCGTVGAKPNGRVRGRRRYLCVGCGRSFGALTGTPLLYTRKRTAWLEYARCLVEGVSLREAASRCGICLDTAWHWRHRFMKAINTAGERLGGIVEADETFVLESRKGNRMSRAEREAAKEAKKKGVPPPERQDRLGRPPRKRGGTAEKPGISEEQVPVLVAADRSGKTLSAVLPEVTAAAIWDVLKHKVSPDSRLVTDAKNVYPPVAKILDVPHEALNQSAGERTRGDLHINTVNNRHSRLKDFLRDRRGVATKYLAAYLRWFHLIELRGASTARGCLHAAMGGA